MILIPAAVRVSVIRYLLKLNRITRRRFLKRDCKFLPPTVPTFFGGKTIFSLPIFLRYMYKKKGRKNYQVAALIDYLKRGCTPPPPPATAQCLISAKRKTLLRENLCSSRISKGRNGEDERRINNIFGGLLTLFSIRFSVVKSFSPLAGRFVLSVRSQATSRRALCRHLNTTLSEWNQK